MRYYWALLCSFPVILRILRAFCKLSAYRVIREIRGRKKKNSPILQFLIIKWIISVEKKKSVLSLFESVALQSVLSV